MSTSIIHYSNRVGFSRWFGFKWAADAAKAEPATGRAATWTHLGGEAVPLPPPPPWPPSASIPCLVVGVVGGAWTQRYHSLRRTMAKACLLSPHMLYDEEKPYAYCHLQSPNLELACHGCALQRGGNTRLASSKLKVFATASPGRRAGSVRYRFPRQGRIPGATAGAQRLSPPQTRTRLPWT
mmetsp:Transcript_36498/g.74160  ORF Transcript_36498/g.74160 Transcript_36498/m.74160 type:complete len:182 (+) Transcript_36498:99-644(+)